MCTGQALPCSWCWAPALDLLAIVSGEHLSFAREISVHVEVLLPIIVASQHAKDVTAKSLHVESQQLDKGGTLSLVVNVLLA